MFERLACPAALERSQNAAIIWDNSYACFAAWLWVSCTGGQITESDGLTTLSPYAKPVLSVRQVVQQWQQWARLTERTNVRGNEVPDPTCSLKGKKSDWLTEIRLYCRPVSWLWCTYKYCTSTLEANNSPLVIFHHECKYQQGFTIRPVSTPVAWFCNGSYRYNFCSGTCFASFRDTSYPPIVKYPKSDHGFWKSGHAHKSTGDCILSCGTNVYCHPAMDQASYDKILRNRRLDDFMCDGQYIILVKLFLYLDFWLSGQISSILMSAVLLNGKRYGTMATANLISWPVQSHTLWIWNAWNWHPKAESGHGFESTGNVLWKLIRSYELTRTQYYWYNQTFYKITLNCTKASILLLYLRIFTQKWIRIGCYLILSLVITYGLISVFYSSIFQCNPVSKAFQKSIPGHCIDVRKTWQANAGFNIASDLMILVLPMPAIHSLQMSRKPKLGLIFLFGLGSLWVYSVGEVEEYS